MWWLRSSAIPAEPSPPPATLLQAEPPEPPWPPSPSPPPEAPSSALSANAHPPAPSSSHDASAQCLLSTQGYWTYEVCLKSNVTQFHAIIKGADRHAVALLGQYVSTTEEGVQLFKGGDLCGASDAAQPRHVREASVRTGCGRHDRVIAIHEPATCRYEVDVELSRLCDEGLG